MRQRSGDRDGAAMGLRRIQIDGKAWTIGRTVASLHFSSSFYGAENTTLSTLRLVGLLDILYSMSARASVARLVSLAFSTPRTEP